MSGLVDDDLLEKHRELVQLADWASDRIEALEAENAELKAAIDAQEVEARYSDTGNLWRFWSDKARHHVAKNARLREALTEIERDSYRGPWARDIARQALTAPERPSDAQVGPSGTPTIRDSEGGA